MDFSAAASKQNQSITMKISNQINRAILSLGNIGGFHLHRTGQDVSLPVWKQCPRLYFDRVPLNPLLCLESVEPARPCETLSSQVQSPAGSQEQGRTLTSCCRTHSSPARTSFLSNISTICGFPSMPRVKGTYLQVRSSPDTPECQPLCSLHTFWLSPLRMV